jgi:hypothetical protein
MLGFQIRDRQRYYTPSDLQEFFLLLVLQSFFKCNNVENKSKDKRRQK